MRRARTNVLILLVTIAFAVLLIFALSSRVDVTSRAIAAISSATHLDVAIDSATIGFFPLALSATNVAFSKDGSKIASAGKAVIGVELTPLSRKKFQVHSLALHDVGLELERDRDGRLNFKTSSDDKSMSAQHVHISVENLNLRYMNRQFGKEFIAEGCASNDADLKLAEGKSSEMMKHISLSAHMTCQKMRNERFVGSNAKFVISGDNGMLKFKPITMSMLGGKASGIIDADFRGDAPSYRVHYAIERLQLNELFKSIAPKRAGEGLLDFTTDLTMHGFNSLELTRSADGEASLTGKDLTLAIGNLDQKLRRYEASQNFNLIDIGAFFIAGPIGPVVTKGVNFASVLEKTDGDTAVRVFISHWQVQNGVAHAQDVALATQENRIAMQGALDFANRRYEGVTFAVLNRRGCATVEQKVQGSFRQPEIHKPDKIKAVTGPVRRLLGKIKDLAGDKCKIFYAGSVAS